jgi:hypothetical protein
VRLAGSIGSVRRALTPGAAKAPADPFDKTLRRIERSQEKVGSLTPDAEEAKAAGTGSSNGATEAGRDNVAPA